ncbi:response regulator [Marispirochaeta aestuarii]|uniref:response regulator transcription factor n=1 Tax=Marispirochaeta aestuarii TaxID=1963862 RepID=UPI0029C7A424|nr:response regulator [Marispirochaeta aestuarii]
MYKAIIIDDEPLVREAIYRLGKWDDFDIEVLKEIPNGAEALEYIKENTVDIIITDMKMPVKDGVELLKEINNLEIPVKILILSAYYNYTYTRQAIHSKVVDYILKPVDAQNLNDALASAVDELENECNENSLEFHSVSNDTIKMVAKYIKENYSRDISLTELSEEFFLSREYISRLFKKEYKLNIFEYISKLRIEKAKKLLKNTNKCIDLIAEEVGYGCGNYFSKVFRRHEKISPSEYKKKSRL